VPVSINQSLPLPSWRERQFSVLPRQRITTWLLFLAAGIIAVGQFLGGQASAYIDLVFIIFLGLPHGALDAELARQPLITRWGRGWFFIFAMPYLALAGAVLLAWRFFPLPTLGFFLAMSALHFGEDRRLSLLQVIVRGAAPIALPILFHPTATFVLLSFFAQAPLGNFAHWLHVIACLWVIPYGITVFQAFKERERNPLKETLFLILIYAVFSPLAALAIYFVCYHSPNHVRELMADKINAPRINSIRRVILFSTPVTALTLLLGVALWPFYHGSMLVRLIALTFQGLAALTLPHMLLEYFLYKNKNIP
jgi:Brp/Blh family beta-carotene 15,15'-monooxygenase